MKLEFLKVCFMGVVEGITEFFPVSSTAHLILFQHILNLDLNHSESFHISIQIGAISAAAFHFKQSFLPFLSFKYWFSSAAQKLYLACFPVLIVGFLSYSFIKMYLFSLKSIVFALLIGGVFMIIAEKIIKKRVIITHLDQISYKKAFIIGLCQCMSLWPGMSRSASTIVGGILTGCSYTVAAEFSFIIGVPVLALAAIYDFLKMFSNFTTNDLIYIFVGIVVSFFVGYIAILTFISLLNRYRLTPFAIYRMIIAGILATVLWL